MATSWLYGKDLHIDGTDYPMLVGWNVWVLLLEFVHDKASLQMLQAKLLRVELQCILVEATVLLTYHGKASYLIPIPPILSKGRACLLPSIRQYLKSMQ